MEVILAFIIVFVLSIVAILLNIVVKEIFFYFIRHSNSAAASVRLRQTYRIIRVCYFILYSILFLVELLAVLRVGSFSHSTSFPHLFLGFIGIGLLPYAGMSLPISSLTMSQFDSINADFALYLRGFSTDSYEPVSFWNFFERFRKASRYDFGNSNSNAQDIFSERNFSKAISKYMPVYSVGMTKELESPEGGKRIYLNDDEWQEKVEILIERAKVIFVLVSSSDSCIWEILKTQEKALEKTIYLMDNPTSTRELIHKIGCPSLPPCLRTYNEMHVCGYLLDGESRNFVYDNSIAGFSHIMRVYFQDKEKAEQKNIISKPVLNDFEVSVHSRFMPNFGNDKADFE